MLFVGEAPGRHGADRCGIPFTGDKFGKRLHGMLAQLGLATRDGHYTACFVTNVVRCCLPANRTPTRQEVANCAPLLAHEFDAIDATVIVPIGRLALHAVGRRYFGADLGSIRALHAQPLRAGPRVIVPMVHPARSSRLQTEAFIVTLRAVLAAYDWPSQIAD